MILYRNIRDADLATLARGKLNGITDVKVEIAMKIISNGLQLVEKINRAKSSIH